MTLLPLLLGCLNPSLSAPEAAAAGGDYKLKGSLYIQVYKDPETLGAALAHDHIIQAAGWSGSASFDPENLTGCKMDITVPVAKLIVDEEGMRKRLGYDTFPTEAERKDIKSKMLGEDQLNGDKFPEITFKATGCEDAGNDRVKVKGDMTIRGVTKSVSVPMVIKADEVNFQAKGAVKIKATDYGFQPYSAGFGALKNQNAMILTVSLKGDPQ